MNSVLTTFCIQMIAFASGMPQAEKNSSTMMASGASVVWTGAELICWGGFDGTRHVATGLHFPAFALNGRIITDKNDNTPRAREGHVAVWTGHSMIVWSGVTDENSFVDGGIYVPLYREWTGIDCPLNVLGRRDATAIWTGREMLVWGGINGSKVLGDGIGFEPSTSKWRRISTENGPSPRVGHLAFWTGAEMVIWGGRSKLLSGGILNNGARYDPITNEWTPMTTVDAPAARQHAYARLAGKLLVIDGGEDVRGTRIRDRASYDLERDAWADPHD